MPEKTKTFIGIKIFGYLFIITSLMNIYTLSSQTNWYLNEVYAHWPRWAAILRYSFSWFQRIIGLTAGCGLLKRWDISRKIILALACFTISTVYWKHPYVAYYYHTQRVVEEYGPQLASMGLGQIAFEPIVMPALILNCLLDIGFNLAVVYYFTRPKVVSQFKRINRFL